jgi:hypothetical protein
MGAPLSMCAIPTVPVYIWETGVSIALFKDEYYQAVPDYQ